MLEASIKKGFIVYIFLSIFEFALSYGSGSLLKLFGFVLMSLWLILLLKKRIKPDRYLLFLVIFYLWMLVTLLWTKGVEFSYYYIFAMGNMVLLVIIASSLSWRREEVSELQKVVQLGALLFSLILLFNGDVYYSSSTRSTIILFGQKLDPNNIAGLLLPSILISYYSILNLRAIILSIGTFLVTLYALISSGSRGGVVAILIGLIVINFQMFFKKRNSNFPGNFKVIVLIALIVIVFYKVVVPHLDKSLLDRLSFSTAIQDRGSNRLDLWQSGLELFKNKPIGGIGIGGFVELTNKGAHNQFLIVLVEGGIIGFVLFSIALYKILANSILYKIRLAQAILISTFIVIFFLDAYQKKFFWNGILLAVIMIKAVENELDVNDATT